MKAKSSRSKKKEPAPARGAVKRKTTKSVRIIAGEFKGLRLEAPGADLAHVMGERERGAVFNALFSLGTLEGAHVLDCFAGSGALGFEALSRGAMTVDFVENNAAVRAVIKRNAAKTDAKSRVKVFTKQPNSDGVACARRHGADAPRSQAAAFRDASLDYFCENYDLIFSDAPYNDPQWELVAKLPEMLARGGRLVISHAKTSPIPADVVAGLRNVYTGTFAGAQIDIFVK